MAEHHDRDFCASRHKGADTSTDAFKRTSDGSRQKQREEILNYLYAAGRDGLTCEEVSKRSNIRYTTCSARISELRHDNLIHFTDKRRKTSTGSTARVYFSGPKPEQQELSF
jgi:hypothetical protein